MIMTPLPTASERADLEAQGTALLDELESFRALHQHYPCSETTVPVSLPETSFGRWHYDAHEGCTDFSLKVGSYRAHGFTLYWNHEKEKWGWDS
jgi:hypothetical protein